MSPLKLYQFFIKTLSTQHYVIYLRFVILYISEILTGGHIPRDSTYVRRKEVIIPLAVYVTMASLAGLGIIAAICLLIFNVIHRKKR